MIAMLTYTSCKEEIPLIRRLTENLAAFESEEKWELHCFSLLREVRAFFEKQPLINMACYDVTKKDSLSLLSGIRKQYKEMLLMLIADDTLSPMEYVRPDILASGLILRPFSKEMMQEKLRDMVLQYTTQAENMEDEEVFVLSVKDGKTRIPYRQIYYMEARDKKIYLRLRDKELAFYDTIEELEKKLPAAFVRCHRSFLVNREYIVKIMLSRNEILLSHGISVPLSRSYKPRFKEFRG